MADTNFIDQGLVYEDSLAVSWQLLEQQPETAQLNLVNETNDLFLRTLVAESTKDPAEDSSAVMQELARLDLKLNLILDLVGQLVFRQLDLPDTCPVKLHAKGMVWEHDNIPKPGEQVTLQLYLQRGMPKPLCFFGQVISSLNEFQAGHAKVVFSGVSQSVEDSLEKFIFQQHRRAIAHAKADPEPSS